MDKLTKLDYTIESPEERKALVEKIIAENPNLTPAYLEFLADYLVLCMEKQEKRQKKILTENRMSTVNKRECSFEGLAAQMENGEDGVYGLMREDKNVLFQPKISITKKDLETIPPLRQLREAIDTWDAALKRIAGTGRRDAFIMRKALIEMRKDQYIIKQAYKKPVNPQKLEHNTRALIPLDDKSYLDDDLNLVIDGISLMDPKVVSAILCNYSKLKEDSYDQFDGDTWYLIQSFEDICDKALADFPIYQRIVELKIDKMQNTEIQKVLQKEFGKTYSTEYLSSLWRNKIPKLIATEATEDFLTWQYKLRGLPMKKCTKCGQSKPAHNQFFSKNKTANPGSLILFHSIQ